jgi:type I restriction-modification system DNA methylase subunit
MSAQPLFSESFWKHNLHTFRLDETLNFEFKQSLISQWINGLKSGVLKKKETTLDADFMNTFFGQILGYEYQISKGVWNLEKKFSVPGGKEADGVLGYFSAHDQSLIEDREARELNSHYKDVRVVIELKPLGTDLDKKQYRVDKLTPVEQAFNYANKLGRHCKWIIVSNYNEIRLYNKIIGEERFEQFFITALNNEYDLKRFFYLLTFQRLFLLTQKSQVDIDLENRQEHLQNITKKFYDHYKRTRLELFEELRKENGEKSPLLLLEKTQKILDRILFICFCEGLSIIQAPLLEQVLDNARNSFGLHSGKIWDQLRGLFQSLDKGLPPYINKFNGGLFKKDTDLDNLVVKDWILEQVLNLRKYDYNNDLTVNILGHIFEQSISDYEKISSQFRSQLMLTGGQSVDLDVIYKKDGKRKSEGIYYTPEYITSYIVAEAIGTWLEDKKNELGFYKLPELTEEEKRSLVFTKQNKIASTGRTPKLTVEKVKKHTTFWLSYRDALRNIRVLDPACGSGAFLVKVFDYLKKEAYFINRALAELKPGQQPEIFDLDKQILTNNIFGVDINQASVEITQLSLWLKTADRTKELTTLDQNIQCGNSVISDPIFAKDLAFNWTERFQKIFQEGGFDIIIGNPPYVSANNMSLTDRNYFNKSSSFSLIQGKWDLYLLFVELSISILKGNGIFSMIVPYGFLNQPFASKARHEILEKHALLSIVDLHTHKVFQDATVPVCIPLIRKDSQTDFVKILHLIENSFTSQYSNNIEDYKNSNQNMFRTENLGRSNSLINKIKSAGSTIDEYFYVSTGAEIHGREEKTEGERQTKTRSKFDSLHKEFEEGFKLYIEGSAIPKSREGRYCYPKIDYYLNYQPSLMRAAKFPELFESDKLVVRASSGLVGIIATFDDRKIYTSHKCTIIIKRNSLPEQHSGYKEDSNLSLYYLLALLNSKLINFYYQTVYGGFIDVYPDYLKPLPIKVISEDEQNIFIDSVKALLDRKKNLEDLKNEFLELLNSDFQLEKQTTKLQNWIDLTWKELTEELKKVDRPLKGQDREDWFLRFKRFGEKIENLQKEINGLDNNIDELVYALYDIGGDRVIVENLN